MNIVNSNFNNVMLPLYRTMTAICFVCNLPIMSHQVGLVWSGGNGWDDLMREQVKFIYILYTLSLASQSHIFIVLIFLGV